MFDLNCTTGSLLPYEPTADKPWNRQRIRHLFRRLGLGATPEQLHWAEALAPDALVDELLYGAFLQPLPVPPSWADWNYHDYPKDQFSDLSREQYILLSTYWIRAMQQESGIREKWALFWHNHFVTRYEEYNCPSFQYAYYETLNTYALGNFKDFVRAIGETPAMLRFLNGLENTKHAPNENYARELFELFTLGENNGYTQQDIIEASRALTGFNGYQIQCDDITFKAETHDAAAKTIFGKTGQYDHAALIDLLFKERAASIAEYICTKIYQAFVHPVADQAIVEGLAETFIAARFELLPMLQQLFKSEHFFDEAVIGVQIKSPIELLVEFTREGGFDCTNEIRLWMLWGSYNQGQLLFQPPDVAGWRGNRAWIDANNLTGRWQLLDGVIYAFINQNQNYARQFLKDLTGQSKSPEVIVHAVIDHFFSRGLVSDLAYDAAVDVFKWEVPQNYYDAGIWSLDWDGVPLQFALLLSHLIRLPEFQLH